MEHVATQLSEIDLIRHIALKHTAKPGRPMRAPQEAPAPSRGNESRIAAEVIVVHRPVVTEGSVAGRVSTDTSGGTARPNFFAGEIRSRGGPICFSEACPRDLDEHSRGCEISA